MFNSIVLDVVIGLVFIYLLYSLLVTIVAEMIATAFAFRAKFLHTTLRRMLTDKKNKKHRAETLVTAFYKHPNIKYLAKNNWYKYPSCITPDRFSTTLINILRKKKTAPTVMEEIKIGLSYFDMSGNPDTKKQLTEMIEDANGDLTSFKTSLEEWFQDMNDRASGWYKRRMKFVLLGIGLVIAFSFNLDSIRIGKTLANNNDARYKLLKIATDTTVINKLGTIVKDTTRKRLNEEMTTLNSTSENISDLIGGVPFKADKAADVWLMILGCLLTGLALSLGAPFWFDLLNKLVALRGGGKSTPAPETEEENTHISNLQTTDNGHHLSEHTTDDPVLLALGKYKKTLFSIPGVIAVNKGYTYSGDQKSPCVEITITKQCDQKLIPALEVIINGAAVAVPSIVMPGNVARKQALRIQNIYYQNQEDGQGTMTCLVNDGKKTSVLSCYHVMQGNNHSSQLDGKLDLISVETKSTIGNIYYLFQSETMDVGLAECTSSNIKNLPDIKGLRAVDTHDGDWQTPVKIYGTSQKDPIEAVVYQTAYAYPFEYDGQTVMMQNLIRLTKYDPQRNQTMPTIGGDSGALVCDKNGMAIGMIIGGIDQYSYALKITEVFDSLKVSLKI